MIDITDRVRVEEGYARKRARATIDHLLETGYGKLPRPGQTVAERGWRPAGALLIRSFDAEGFPIVLERSYQYLSKDRVWYIYVLTAVRHPKTGEVHPRYMPVEYRPDEVSARTRAAEIAAELPPVVDTNGDGVIDFRDMPVVEVA